MWQYNNMLYNRGTEWNGTFIEWLQTAMVVMYLRLHNNTYCP